MKAASSQTLLILIMLLLYNQKVHAQQYILYYKLIKANDTVGEMTVAENRTEVQRTITTTTKAFIPTLLIDIVMEDIKYSEFRNQVLQSAIVTRRFFNGNPLPSKTVKSEGVYTDGKRPLTSLNGITDISYTSTMLYTTEPLNKSQIYSEYHHQFMNITRIAEHAYHVRFPDGQKCYYYYDKGICVRIVTETTWATIESILISQNLAYK